MATEGEEHEVDLDQEKVQQQSTTLDLSSQGLKKVEKAQSCNSQHVTTLILDSNELQKWDGIETYPNLQKLSATHNQMIRMYGISRLHHIHTLNLSHNGILTIEGLKEMIHLKWLSLAANNIKTIEHLHTNTNLEHIDLSENNISHISDLSFLKSLKHLLLHGNRISQLRQCERYLPTSLEMLTLAANKLTDLNEVSHLANLISLREITFMNNPCVDMNGKDRIGFDYRPFLINWLMSLKVIDGFVVDPIESLKAEWLYSQGRGRQFRVGEHQALAEYLSVTCPVSGDSLESEEERKLRLILSKAQQHQQQLKLQQSDVGRARSATVLNRSLSSPAPSPVVRRRVNSAHNSYGRNGSPRRTSLHSKLPVTERVKSPDRMMSSLHTSIHSNVVAESEDISLMTRSLDPTLLFPSSNGELEASELIVEDCPISDASSGALQGASKLVPVPESLMSPEYRQPVIPKPRPTSANVKRGSPKSTRSSRPKSAPSKPICKPPSDRASPVTHHSSDEDSEVSTSKLDSILQRAQQRRQKCMSSTPVQTALPAHTTQAPQPPSVLEMPLVNGSSDSAALCIQRMWRGYRTRNLDKKVINTLQRIQMARTTDVFQKLSSNMESTMAALEDQRKSQLLQTQAMNALWNKMAVLQPETDGETIKELAQTCSQLYNQVSQLQESMNNIMQRMDLMCRPTAETSYTQTDIVAVHTPQAEVAPFPYQRTPRPSSLPLPGHAPEEVQQFATSLVDDVLKTVASGDGDNSQEVLDNGNNLESSPAKEVSSQKSEESALGELLSLEENSSSIMIRKQPPSSVTTPSEQDSPNNNTATSATSAFIENGTHAP